MYLHLLFFCSRDPCRVLKESQPNINESNYLHYWLLCVNFVSFFYLLSKNNLIVAVGFLKWTTCIYFTNYIRM